MSEFTIKSDLRSTPYEVKFIPVIEQGCPFGVPLNVADYVGNVPPGTGITVRLYNVWLNFDESEKLPNTDRGGSLTFDLPTIVYGVSTSAANDLRVSIQSDVGELYTTGPGSDLGTPGEPLIIPAPGWRFHRCRSIHISGRPAKQGLGPVVVTFHAIELRAVTGLWPDLLS